MTQVLKFAWRQENLENRTTPEIIFYNNPTKNLNQKSINQKSSEEKEWCKDNPKFCSDKQLCDRVTRLPQRSLFGIDIFEKTEIDLKYETEKHGHAGSGNNEAYWVKPTDKSGMGYASSRYLQHGQWSYGRWIYGSFMYEVT